MCKICVLVRLYNHWSTHINPIKLLHDETSLLSESINNSGTVSEDAFLQVILAIYIFYDILRTVTLNFQQIY